jgi:hypothetical protein
MTNTTNLMRTEMLKALRKYKDANGQAAVRKLLESIAGVTAASLVADDKIADVIDATRGDNSALHIKLGAIGKKAFAKSRRDFSPKRRTTGTKI